MQTWLKIILGSVVTIAIIIYAYFYWTTDYPIYTNAQNLNGYPKISWLAVIDGRLERSLQRQWKKDKITQFSDTAIPVNTMQKGAEGYYNTTGIRFVSLPDDDIKSGTYTDSLTHPYKWVSFYKTNIWGDAYYLLVQVWKNKNNTVSFLPLILQETQVINNGQITDYYRDLVKEGSIYFPAPIFEYSDSNTCITDMGKTKGFCNWLFRFPWRMSKYKSFMSMWVETGILPKEMGRYPLPLTVKLTSWKGKGI